MGRLHRATTRLAPAWALVALVAACASQPVEQQPCPNLSYALDVVYGFGGPLELGGSVSGNLDAEEGQPRFVGHPVAVPVAGGVTLTFTLSGGDLPKTATLYIYGPRGDDGIFGTCTSQQVAASATVVVPEDGGGEWLVLVGADPIADAKGAYQLSAACEGDGCGEGKCPLLLGSCETEVCAGGFDLSEDSGISCPACACDGSECGAFQTLVFDECVCDCQVPLNAAPVCGADGQTYTTACFAECAQVAVARADGACETACPTASDCSLECPNGFRVVDGCPTCACAGPCDSGGPHRPVCGSDGFTYGSRERMECETDGVQVAYVGPCLPYCATPPECALSCEYGLRPAADSGEGCFDCECVGSSSDKGPLQCAVSEPNDAGDGLPVLKTPKQRLAGVRTFPDGPSAVAAGFRPVFADACPTSICLDDSDCLGGDEALTADLAQILDAPSSTPVVCDRIGKSPTRACRTAQPLSSTACECLNRPGAHVYDPVCATLDGQPRTFFNLCTATCIGAWPTVYPGECCATRLSISERATHFQGLTAVCKAQGPARVARVFTETACPPSLEECADPLEPDRCCTDAPPKQPGAPR